ncbi:hypothetical protein BJY01DRAFT_222195 [Aspergillus pseudoustus]|uniref:BZIP domain-containing protein n=1 Tax=Aspergillus pseudoustus TaxID=1810923 RepID=A0ABR4J8C2_9EURO
MLGNNYSLPNPSAFPVPRPANASQLSDDCTLASDILPGAGQTPMMESQPLPPELPGATASSKTNRQRTKRGRPRIPMEEEISPDRRKTQIRRAQRAYRARKEATVVSLNNRIRDLETVVERLNTTFLSFSDEVLKLGLLAANPDLAQKLHQSMEQFLSLTKQAVSIVDDDDDDADNADHEAEDKGNFDLRANHSVESTPFTAPQEERSRPTRQALSYPFQDTQPDPQTEQSYLPFLKQIPLGSIRKAGESGFIQRLSLACMKMGYACLNDPAPNTQMVNQRLALPLRIVTRQSLLEFFHLSLRMGHSYDTSGQLTLPFFTIGGAGMHYLDYRRDYIPENSAVQWGLMNGTTDQGIDYGMGDTWFDCYDVEGYLKENGVIPISELPSSTQPPPRSGSLEGGSRNLRGNIQLQSSSVQNNLLHVPTNKIIDEGALIGLLSRSCVCLGRAPGFRRVEVERFLIQIGTSY